MILGFLPRKGNLLKFDFHFVDQGQDKIYGSLDLHRMPVEMKISRKLPEQGMGVRVAEGK